MSYATKLAVGMLMIAMLVGLGASAEAPVDTEDDPSTGTMEKGHLLEVDDVVEHTHPLFNSELLVVGSTGGAHTCYGDCPLDDEPPLEPDIAPNRPTRC